MSAPENYQTDTEQVIEILSGSLCTTVKCILYHNTIEPLSARMDYAKVIYV